MKYTKQEILKAAKIGEVSMIDARHIVSLLDEAKSEIKNNPKCETCFHYFTNPFDNEFCKLDYDLENGKTCRMKKYERIENIE